jgi:xanthine dehydrogenase small subunit
MKSKKETLNMIQISFWVNGNEVNVSVPPGMTAMELINDKLGLTGTKSSCNEGDCGACTVVIGQMKESVVQYNIVTSCIYPAYRLNSKHLITIEGISAKSALHPIQAAILDEHGTQCGFCTPGFVMAILGLLLNNSNPTDEDILAGLEGNLCRCTGYDSILKAVKLAKENIHTKEDLLPARLRKVEHMMKEQIPPVCFEETDNAEGWETLTCFLPKSLSELWDNLNACKHIGRCRLISGGTDLMVQANIQHIRYSHLIDLGNIKELYGITAEKGEICIGANSTMNHMLKSPLLKEHFPVLLKAIKQIGSTQIRNSATLAGNIANASPVADGATVLLALGAKVMLASRDNERTVKLSSFYQGYKKTVLKQGEIIKAITIPLPVADKVFTSFIKSAKRKAVDISGVVSVMLVEYDKGKITRAVISFGGVAPYPALANKTMTFLNKKKLEDSWFAKAGEEAMGEFIPLTDIRGSKDYRSLLVKNHIIKHLKQLLLEVKA